MILAINIHDEGAVTGTAVQRKHYTVAQLIAELRKYNDEDVIVVRDLKTRKFGSIDFQGLTLED